MTAAWRPKQPYRCSSSSYTRATAAHLVRTPLWSTVCGTWGMKYERRGVIENLLLSCLQGRGKVWKSMRGGGGSNLVGIICPTLIGIMATFLRGWGGGEEGSEGPAICSSDTWPKQNRPLCTWNVTKSWSYPQKKTNERNHSSQLFNLKWKVDDDQSFSFYLFEDLTKLKISSAEFWYEVTFT